MNCKSTNKKHKNSIIIYILIGVIGSVLSRNLKYCTNITTACPLAAQWTERSKEFNCPGRKRYICLISIGNELREGCRFNSTIQAGQIGCPYADQCDPITDQPVLVAPQNFLLCPPETTGCPPRNHSGYSILDIYKYSLCQKTRLNETRYSPTNNVYTGTTQSFNSTLQTSQDISDNNSNSSVGVGVGVTCGVIGLMVVIIVIFRRNLRDKCDKNTPASPEEGVEFVQDAEREVIIEIPEVACDENRQRGHDNSTDYDTSSDDDDEVDPYTDFVESGNSTEEFGFIKSESRSRTESPCTTQWDRNCATIINEEQCNDTVEFYCLMCEDRCFCKKCSIIHIEQYTAHDVVPYVNNKGTCKTHAAQSIKYYCMRCQQYICRQCLIELTHQLHGLQRLSERIQVITRSVRKDVLKKLSSKIAINKIDMTQIAQTNERIALCGDVSRQDKERRVKDNEKTLKEMERKQIFLKRKKKHLKQILRTQYIPDLEYILTNTSSSDTSSEDKVKL